MLNTAPSESFPTRFWSAAANDRVQCDVCPNHCRLAEGQRGACFVRANRNGAIVLTTHGRSSGFCIDPIEKKPLNHFLPGTPVLSFGTAGCNLTCSFCQNWSISRSREMETLAARASPEAIARAAQALACRSVAFTYNDPVVFLEYAIDTARACHDLNLRTVAVTAGYMCAEPRRELYRHIDAANVDLKAFTDSFYRKVCGGRLDAIKETLLYLRHETQVWLELTTLLIPGENDSDAELHALTGWVRDALGPDVPLHFTAFHPDHRMLDRPATPAETLARARRIGRGNGLQHVYTGNVHDEEGGSTWCPSCGTKLIGRDWFEITAWHLDASGACATCGTPCPGRFEREPGHWGARRQPVNLDTFA